jgi:hypothetical protein
MRRLTLLALAGTLVLSACSDQDSQSPTEPSIAPPSETFGSTCDHGRYPLKSVALLIPAAYPTTLAGYKALRAEALVRVGAIALLWDFCKDRLARQAALKTIAWIDLKSQSDARDALKAAILNGFGGASTPVEDFVSGLYVPGVDNQIFTAFGGRATLELGDCAFSLPTLITIRRLSDDFRLSGHPEDRQDPPFWDYDATNASTDNTLATHTVGSCTPGGPPDAIMAFCFNSDGEGGHVEYPSPGARIGHNPVGGGFEFVQEVAIPVELQEELSDCPFEYGYGPFFRMGSAGGGLSESPLTWSSAGHYLAKLARTLFLPAPLQATVVGPRGPIAGAPSSLSPFGLVLPDCPIGGPYTSFCLDSEG